MLPCLPKVALTISPYLITRVSFVWSSALLRSLTGSLEARWEELELGDGLMMVIICTLISPLVVGVRLPGDLPFVTSSIPFASRNKGEVRRKGRAKQGASKSSLIFSKFDKSVHDFCSIQMLISDIDIPQNFRYPGIVSLGPSMGTTLKLSQSVFTS